jgi:hypothetical protein
MRAPTAEQVAMLARLYASPKPTRAAPAAALLAIEPAGRAVRVTVERPGGAGHRFDVTQPSDARLESLRPIDRRRIALALGEVRR